MSGPSAKPKHGSPEGRTFVPHPDDEADVRAGLEEGERGELLSEEESAAYLRALVGDEPASK
jgi:hypothetical protein